MNPGDTLWVDVNQGTRSAVVLAVLGPQTLIEYDMPAGTSALRILEDGKPDRSVSYRGLPIKWLRAVVEAGSTWTGIPQQTTWNAPSPEKLLAVRLERPAPALEVGR